MRRRRLPPSGARGENVLLPRPGFPLFETLLKHAGVECRFYDLDADKQWEADLDSIRRAADANTRAIVACNPSNPCGSVWSREHMSAFVDVVAELDIVLIADETYHEMSFEEGAHVMFNEVCAGRCTVLTVGGTAKRYLVPGWRLGWTLLHDPLGKAAEIRAGLSRASQLIMGPCVLIQGALPDMLTEVPEQFYRDTMKLLEENARVVVDALKEAPGLRVIEPQGAFYALVGIDTDVVDVEDDVDFGQRLVTEQSVFALPASIFGAKNYVRIVLCPPADKLREACARMVEFCKAHQK